MHNVINPTKFSYSIVLNFKPKRKREKNQSISQPNPTKLAWSEHIIQLSPINNPLQVFVLDNPWTTADDGGRGRAWEGTVYKTGGHSCSSFRKLFYGEDDEQYLKELKYSKMTKS